MFEFAEGKLPHAIFVGFYLLVLIGVGAVKARKVKSQADFSLAGRGLSTIVLVGTLLATWIGTGSIFGNAGETYRRGLDAFILPIAGSVGIVFLYYISSRLRSFEGFTIQDILEARFGIATRVLGTITLVGAYIIIVSYQYRAGAAVLQYIMPDIGATAMYIVAVLVILYTALAGMYSVAYTDVVNGVLMTVGVVLAIPFLLAETGGMGGAIEALPTAGQTFGNYSFAKIIGVLLPTFLLLVGDANMVQRFFSAKDPRSARISAGGMLAGVVLLETAIILLALLSTSLVSAGSIPAPANDGHIIIHAAFEALPTWLGALIVGTVVAIVVSTADSYLLSPATALVRDVYQRFCRPHALDAEMVLTSRIIVVVAGVLALFLATLSDAFFSVALFAYTIYGVGITPVLLAAYFWKRATTAGALSSMGVGVATALFWRWVTTTDTQDALREGGWSMLSNLGQWATRNEVDAVIPSFLLATIALVGVSLAGRPPSAERANAFSLKA